MLTGSSPPLTRQGISAAPASRLRGSRAAKARANQKLDAQAKDLAEFQRQMAASSGTSPRSSKGITLSRTLHRPAGIRLSARLRGPTAMEEEWQEIPEEWLSTKTTAQDTIKEPSRDPSPQEQHNLRTGLESDDDTISDLTDLSDDGSQSVTKTEESNEQVEDMQSDERPDVEEPIKAHEEFDCVEGDEEQERAELEKDHPTQQPEDFIEWETVSSSACLPFVPSLS